MAAGLVSAAPPGHSTLHQHASLTPPDQATGFATTLRPTENSAELTIASEVTAYSLIRSISFNWTR